MHGATTLSAPCYQQFCWPGFAQVLSFSSSFIYLSCLSYFSPYIHFFFLVLFYYSLYRNFIERPNRHQNSNLHGLLQIECKTIPAPKRESKTSFEMYSYSVAFDLLVAILLTVLHFDFSHVLYVPYWRKTISLLRKVLSISLLRKVLRGVLLEKKNHYEGIWLADKKKDLPGPGDVKGCMDCTCRKCLHFCLLGLAFSWGIKIYILFLTWLLIKTLFFFSIHLIYWRAGLPLRRPLAS